MESCLIERCAGLDDPRTHFKLIRTQEGYATLRPQHWDEDGYLTPENNVIGVEPGGGMTFSSELFKPNAIISERQPLHPCPYTHFKFHLVSKKHHHAVSPTHAASSQPPPMPLHGRPKLLVCCPGCQLKMSMNPNEPRAQCPTCAMIFSQAEGGSPYNNRLTAF